LTCELWRGWGSANSGALYCPVVAALMALAALAAAAAAFFSLRDILSALGTRGVFPTLAGFTSCVFEFDRPRKAIGQPFKKLS